MSEEPDVDDFKKTAKTYGEIAGIVFLSIGLTMFVSTVVVIVFIYRKTDQSWLRAYAAMIFVYAIILMALGSALMIIAPDFTD